MFRSPTQFRCESFPHLYRKMFRSPPQLIWKPQFISLRGPADGVVITHAEAIWILGTLSTSIIIN